MTGKKVTLTTEAYDNKLAALKEIDVKLTALKGTAGEWMKKGAEAARSTYFDTFKGLDNVAHDNFVDSIKESATVGAYLDLMRQHLEASEQFSNELATAWIKANRKDSDESEALKAQRSKLAEEAEAMRSVFAQVGVTDLLEVPKAPSGRSTSTGSGRVNTKGIHFYAVRADGSRQEMSPTNDTLGGIAWYVFGKGKGGVPADDVKAALKKAGWDGTLTTSQQHGPIIVAGVKASVGWEVTETPTNTAPVVLPDSQVTDPAKSLDEEVKADAAS